MQISPDGSRIVYVRVSHDIMTDRARRNLWMINADGTNNRPLRSEIRSFSSPRWSPDGTRIAYVSAAEGSPQLYVRWMDSGQTALLTNLVEAPDAIAWSPDGKSIAFTQLVPANKAPLAAPPPKPEGRDLGAAGEGHRFGDLSRRRRGLSRVRLHSTCSSSRPKAARRASSPTATSTTTGPLSFTPDGKHSCSRRIAAPDWERDPQNSEVFSVDVATQKLTQLTSRQGPDNSPVVSPDGKQDRLPRLRRPLPGLPGHSSICDGLDGAQLARGHRQASTATSADPKWAADSRGIYFSYDERGVRKLGYTTLDGKVRTLAEGLGGTDLGRPYTSGSFSVARNGRAAFSHNSPRAPGRRGHGDPARAARAC